jgi:hypothetical protein
VADVVELPLVQELLLLGEAAGGAAGGASGVRGAGGRRLGLARLLLLPLLLLRLQLKPALLGNELGLVPRGGPGGGGHLLQPGALLLLLLERGLLEDAGLGALLGPLGRLVASGRLGTLRLGDRLQERLKLRVHGARDVGAPG